MTVNLTTHVSGLASGMDTESIVSGLMKANRVPLDKLMQAKTLNGWKTDAYREVNTKIASFRDAMQDLRLQGSFNAQKVSASNSAVSVTMSGVSSQSTFTISEAQLAQPARAAVASFYTGIQSGSDLIDSHSKDTPPSSTTPFTFDLSVGATTANISIPRDSTLDQAVSTINSALSNAKLGVKVSNVGGSLVFKTDSQGAAQSFSITNTSADTQSFLNIKDGSFNGVDLQQGYAIINGTKMEVASNTFTFDGVQFNLQQDIKAVGTTPPTPTIVSVTADTDKIFDKIKTFVDQYNTLITDLNEKISETKNRDYPPLTDDQKTDMKDSDITLWENKAKEGLLSNDPTISQFLNKLRTAISQPVKGTGISSAFDTLQEIGITTSTDYKEHGKLTLDETKLKSLLSSNLSDVQNLFAAKFETSKYSDTTITSLEKYDKSGVGVRLYDQIADTLSKLKVIAGSPGTVSYSSDLAKEALSLDDRISLMQDRLDSQEQALWTKFNTMEESLQKLNTQSSWLSQQFSY